MNCTLCGKKIEGYAAELHHIDIDEKRSAEICSECVDKLMKWHGKKYALLFPTTAMKKRFGKKK